MRKVPLWVTFGLVFTTCILFLSCCTTSPSSTSPETSAPASKPPISSSVPSSSASPETPKYGGEFIFHGSTDVTGFDPAITVQMDCRAEYQVTDELIGEDWAKGPAGTGETEWTVGFIGRFDLQTGSLAESWEIPDSETIIFNIRKGVNWQNKVPVNGREFTADDVIWNIDRNMTTQRAYLYGAFPPALRPLSWEALDKYTVEIKTPKESLGLWLIMFGDFMWMVPREVIDTYGDMTNWRNVVGTGPFILKDYVSGSSVTYERNPGYWKKDPMHPENQLPYIEKLKMLIITDTSTQQSALRTGRLDRLDALEYEDAHTLQKNAPDLKLKKYLPSMCPVLVGRIDKQELPFKDINVRRALNMAINKQEIIDTYYSGDAELFAYPYQPTKAYEPFYTPLEEQPAEVQELFKYNPQKAKQLLSEAGYPNGFKAQVDCQSGTAADYLSMIKAYLDPIGVELEINPLESGVYLSVYRGKTSKEMIYKNQTTHAPFRIMAARLESIDDHAYFETTRTREAYNWVNANLFNEAEVAKYLKEYGVYELSQVWGVWLPVPYYNVLWWPWVQNYRGEVTLGWDNQTKFTHYIWVDMSIKKSLTKK